MKRAFYTVFLLALSFVFIGWIQMAHGQSAEEQVFETPPYLTAARAITAGDAATLQRLIEAGLDVDYEGRETFTPWGQDTVTLLVWATIQDQPACAEALLKAGANPNKGTRQNVTPLNAAVASSDELFELLLIRYNADPNVIYDGAGVETALIAQLRQTDLGDKRWRRAEMLLEHGADINLGFDRGETAVISFTIFERWPEVLWLLEHGADPEARNKIDATMMDYLRDSYTKKNDPPAHSANLDKVRDWLLAHGVERSRIEPPPGQQGK